MMGRARDASRRALQMLSRGIVTKANDKPKCQEHDIKLFNGEVITGVENFGHSYGFHSVPRPPDDEKGKQAAEVLVGFIGGNRSHGMILGFVDRRYQPTDWKEGESGLHDHQGQKMHVTNDGIQVDGGDKKLPVTFTIGDAKHTFDEKFYEVTRGNATLRVEDGKITATVGGTSSYFLPDGAHLGGMGGSPIETVAGTATKAFAV